MAIAPGLKRGMIFVAARFEDTGDYAARVLEGTPMHPVAPPSTLPWNPWLGWVILAAAVATGTVHATSKTFRHSVNPILSSLRILHRLHSGHVGDYAAFLTFRSCCVRARLHFYFPMKGSTHKARPGRKPGLGLGG